MWFIIMTVRRSLNPVLFGVVVALTYVAFVVTGPQIATASMMVGDKGGDSGSAYLFCNM
jgi:hypothetical protein